MEIILIPDTIVNVYIVVILLIIFAAIVNRNLKSMQINLQDFLNVIEIAVEAVENLVKQTMGEKHYGLHHIYLLLWHFY